MESLYVSDGTASLTRTCATEEKAAHAGFTLIELLVVFSIIVIIMGVVFTSQGSFNKTLVLTTTAYDIALTVRDAATFGLGSRAAGTVTNSGYGVHFDKTIPISFALFADTSPAASCSTPDCKSGDGIYTSGSDSLVRSYTLGNGITVSDFCAYANGWSCTSVRNGSASNVTSLDVVFTRPNPVPTIYATAGGSALSATAACIVISSSFGASRYVTVSSAGQISVTSTSCP